MMGLEPVAVPSAWASLTSSAAVGAKYGPHSNQIRPRPGCRGVFVDDTVPVGFPVTLYSAGGFWVKNSGRERPPSA